MFPGRNLSQFVSIDDLVSIEREAIFGFSRNVGHSQREWFVLQVADLTCQRPGRKRAIDRGGPEAQYRSHCQHNRNQRHKAQHSQTKLGAQRDCHSNRQHSGKCKRDCRCLAPWKPMLQNDVLDHQRRNDGRRRND